MTPCTRFAPSPTGYLHIGGARTALFSWLYARTHGGRFILRIEDTDLERSTAESVNAILEGITWLGLEYDAGPFYQTHRFDRYREVAKTLLAAGKAYYCYCSKEELDQMRAEQTTRKEKPRYDGRCRNRVLPREGVSPVLRFRNPEEGSVIVKDLIRGVIEFRNEELDDLILLRSDGTPTYNFTVVVDDWDMKITHVIRGDDHLNNTPRQMNLLHALGAQIPAYAHVPMILGEDGSRLSKRHGAVSVMTYREEGYLPEALLNYLVRLGWSYGDQEIFSVDEMIRFFNIERVQHSSSTFNSEKLLWLNQHYLKTSDPAHVAHHLRYHLGQLGIDPTTGPDPIEVVLAQRERAKTLVEMATNSAFLYQESIEYSEDAFKKHLRPEILPTLEDFYARLSCLEDWSTTALHETVIRCAEDQVLKLGKLAQPIRVAVTGKSASPPIDITLSLLGRERTLQRLALVIEKLR
ncbi:glutamate--tRNA ligase [Gammaproteobacteria bacterium]